MNWNLAFACVTVALALTTHPARAAGRPNILWITSEDNGPQLGCYGDQFATTPNLDHLASRGIIYRNVWSIAPVCAPARTAIISGLYPSSTGSEHMRSQVRLPAGMKMHPQFLRESGYYCSNNSKEDYNLEKPGQVWDDSSARAHWRNRAAGQPFFAVFNILDTHESQIRKRPHTAIHDPARVPLPAYHPDTPEARQDWAQYYDQMTVMDMKAGRLLEELKRDHLEEDTIIFYYGDHGPGMPRCKRTACNSGLQVPLIVYFPEKWRHLAPKDYRPGGDSGRLVGFVDLAPTLLSIAGIRPPEWMQGRAFAGEYPASPPRYLFGLRGRMDERYDLVRAVRDERYVYVRNYLPHRPHGQHVAYMFETPTTRVWKRMYDEGKLNPAQSRYWETRQPEELYDLREDPDETRNLADSAAHRKILARLRKAHREHTLAIRDVDLLPEPEMLARAAGRSPYELGHDPDRFAQKQVFDAAELAANFSLADLPRLKKSLEHKENGVRFWAATGLLIRGKPAVVSAAAQLKSALNDPSPAVRIPAAEALGKFGDDHDVELALDALTSLVDVRRNDYFVCAMALNAIDELGMKANSKLTALKALPQRASFINPRMQEYVERLLQKIIADLAPKA
jgi:arylsulfatase A-like enzyme